MAGAIADHLQHHGAKNLQISRKLRFLSLAHSHLGHFSTYFCANLKDKARGEDQTYSSLSLFGSFAFL